MKDWIGTYILDGKEVVPVSTMVWAERFSLKNRILRQEFYQRHGERIFVSTVFLGVDHQYGDGPPLLFETMVFDGKLKRTVLLGKEREIHEEIWCDRWSTYDQAIAGHEMLMQRAKVEILGCKLKNELSV